MEPRSLKPACALLGALLLASAMGADEGADQRKPRCTLAGRWVNDLGSQMELLPTNEAGFFSGSYLTAVSSANQAIVQSPLQGAQHNPANTAQPTFGFTVHWTFSDSTTVFVGQCFVDDHGVETLQTMWLLRKEMASSADDWKGTLVGKNIFTRLK